MPPRLRDDTDDKDVFRPSETGWSTGALVFGMGGRVRLLTEGERFRDKPDPADTIDIASRSFPVLNDDVGERVFDIQWPSDSVGELSIAATESGACPGPRCCLTSVLSSRPLNASSSVRPSASTRSISCRISFDDCKRSSSSSVSMMPIWAFRASVLSDAAGNEEGGMDGARLTLRASED